MSNTVKFNTIPELIQFLYNLLPGSIVKLGKVEFCVLESAFDQKIFEPIYKRHRSGVNYLFVLNSEEANANMNTALLTNLECEIIFKRE